MVNSRRGGHRASLSSISMGGAGVLLVSPAVVALHDVESCTVAPSVLVSIKVILRLGALCPTAALLCAVSGAWDCGRCNAATKWLILPYPGPYARMPVSMHSQNLDKKRSHSVCVKPPAAKRFAMRGMQHTERLAPGMEAVFEVRHANMVTLRTIWAADW